MQNFTKRETLKISAMFILAVVIMFIALYLSIVTKGEKIYNCSISEISPDYPIAVKEGCRKLRAEKV